MVGSYLGILCRILGPKLRSFSKKENLELPRKKNKVPFGHYLSPNMIDETSTRS